MSLRLPIATLGILKQPNQLQEESFIRKAFADAGLILQSPNFQERRPHYRCKTQYFDIIFDVDDAGLAFDLASVAGRLRRELTTAA